MAVGIGKHYISDHALKRVRERWPVAAALPKRDLLKRLASSIESAVQNKMCVKTPGGLYVPFDLGDEEGFMVIKEDCVVTIVPKEWATEVSDYLETRKQNG